MLSNPENKEDIYVQPAVLPAYQVQAPVVKKPVPVPGSIPVTAPVAKPMPVAV